ncbi:putative ribonuclease ZC3H12B [Caerostris extrusa]|uniref:Ribonuclease ZC3H12B n=1 Tax=Caerostris extrusa TaxID=172846 RepID=A0AAV4XE84_CAEEX|nr:putative ribonuclease ZC3H12B [Caerostris extrusa]
MEFTTGDTRFMSSAMSRQSITTLPTLDEHVKWENNKFKFIVINSRTSPVLVDTRMENVNSFKLYACCNNLLLFRITCCQLALIRHLAVNAAVSMCRTSSNSWSRCGTKLSASPALVRFEVPDNQVLISGQERCILAAQRFLDAKAQDIVLSKSKGKPPDTMGDLSQVGTQSREVFRQGRNLESEDSSYDSDCEVAESTGTPQGELPGMASDPHHDDVSRTVSDTLGAEFAEYVTHDPVEAVMADPNYTGRVEFALKLGYTEKQVQTALQKLGPQPSQNELLAELIRLGASGPPFQSAPRMLESAITLISQFDTGTADLDDPSNLRHIVIDGSNVAMR